MTVDPVTTRVPRRTGQPGTLGVQEQLAVEMIKQARKQGLALTGPDGLLGQLTKTVLEPRWKRR